MELHYDASNLKDLEDFFDGLERTDQTKVLNAAYRKAVVPLLNAARIGVPKGRMMGLYRSLGTETIPGEAGILVGSKRNTKTMVRGRGGTYLSKVWYAHLVELGSWKTGERHWRPLRKVKRGYYKGEWRGGDKSTGTMPASHFFENACNATEDQVFSSIGNEWYDSIARYIQRTNKKVR